MEGIKFTHFLDISKKGMGLLKNDFHVNKSQSVSDTQRKPCWKCLYVCMPESISHGKKFL